MSKHTPAPWEFLEAGHTEEEFNVGMPLTIGEVDHPHNDIASVYSADDATVSITREQAIANARLIAAAPDLLGALLLLTGNPHINLGDLVYQVREREGKGWDGPAVLAWSQACEAAKVAIAKATGAVS